MASCVDAQFCFLYTYFVKMYHLSALDYGMKDTLHGFLFGCTVLFPHTFCLHNFTELGIHCMASCFISFVCKRVSSRKSSWLLEVTSHVNSCRVVTTWRHLHLPLLHAGMTISGDCSQTSCGVCQLPVRMTSWISRHDFCQDDLFIHRDDSTHFECIGN